MDNLRYYLASCALPPMPLARNAPLPPSEGHKSHQNHLQVRPETWRRLENIFPLEGAIDEAITRCKSVQQQISPHYVHSTVNTGMDEYVPGEPLDLSDIDPTEERLTIPCAMVVHISLDMMKKPDNVLRYTRSFQAGFLTHKISQNGTMARQLATTDGPKHNSSYLSSVTWLGLLFRQWPTRYRPRHVSILLLVKERPRNPGCRYWKCPHNCLSTTLDIVWPRYQRVCRVSLSGCSSKSPQPAVNYIFRSSSLHFAK